MLPSSLVFYKGRFSTETKVESVVGLFLRMKPFWLKFQMQTPHRRKSGLFVCFGSRKCLWTVINPEYKIFISLELIFPSVMCRPLLFFSYLYLKNKPNQIPKTKQQTHKQFKTSFIKPLTIQHRKPLLVLGCCLDFLNVTRNCKLVNCIPYFLRNYSD